MRRRSRALCQLEGMGFPTEDAGRALQHCNGDVQRAVDFLTGAEATTATARLGDDDFAPQDDVHPAPPPADEDNAASKLQDSGAVAGDQAVGGKHLDAAQSTARPAAHQGDADFAIAILDGLLHQAATADEDDAASQLQSSGCRAGGQDAHATQQRPQELQADVRSPVAGSVDQKLGKSEQSGFRSRKRRARAPAGATDRTARRTIDTVGVAPRRWQWLAKAGWQEYDQTVCEHLELNFSAGLDRTQITLGRSNPAVYVVDFDQMVQFPKISQGRRRKVRRCDMPRHKPRQEDEGSSSDNDDFDFNVVHARVRKPDGGGATRDTSCRNDHSRTTLNAQGKSTRRKEGKSATTKKHQPSLASFLKSTQETRESRDCKSKVLSQRTINRQPTATQRGGNGSEDEIDDIEPSQSQPLPTTLRPAVATANSQLWTDKYTPGSIETLAVHKTGVERVRGWMRESLRALSASQHSVRASAPSVLVLKGPPGSGKTSLVRLLATELQCSVREWSSPVGASSWGSEERLSGREWHDQHRVPYEGSLDPLEHFLLGAAKYCMLPGVASISAPGSSSGANGQNWSQEIILVDELPQLAKIEHRERFYALVRSVAERTRSPVVFILSSHRAGKKGSMGDATSSNIYFPDSLLNHPQVTEQKLLEINKTSLEKTLRAINLAESSGSNNRGKGVRLATIKAIAASCHGDVRAAVHSLQFESLGGGSGTSSGRSESKRKLATSAAAKAAAGSEGLALGSRDVRLDMFRALGRILYNKRIDPSDEQSISASDATRHAAAESRVRAELRRLPIKNDAEDVVDGYDVDWPRLCEQLQQNYLGFFTKTEDVEVAAKGLSDGALLGCWQEDRPAFDIACSIAASATVRAIRWANTAPSEATFRPFHYQSSSVHSEQQDANWRGADEFLVSSGVAGCGETTVRSRQARFELANYVQFMQHNGGLPATSGAVATVTADDLEDEIDEIE